ncbi:MAG: hypothetical protein J6A19_14660 [Oscillospiraceae bacterium]|nr:hypothetical protein [Oscillospiraceae bacterium]
MAEIKKLVDLELLSRFNDKTSLREDTKDAATLASAKSYTDTEIGKVTTDASALADRVAAVEGKASANETAIGVLNGDETTAGSVKKAVADGIAKIVADAPESLDTLKEISDWISSHSNDAAAMNSAIQTNSSAITALQTLIGTLPSGISATDVVGYIQEAVAAAKTYADNLDTAMDARVDVLEADNTVNKAAIESINNASTGILATAKAYTDTEVAKVDAKVTTNTNAIAAINDPSTGAIATAEAYTDSSIAALSQAGGAIKTLSDSVDAYKTATDTRLDKVEAAVGSFATTDDIDALFATV